MSLRDCRSDVILGGKSNVHVWVRLRVNVDRAGGADFSSFKKRGPAGQSRFKSRCFLGSEYIRLHVNKTVWYRKHTGT